MQILILVLGSLALPALLYAAGPEGSWCSPPTTQLMLGIDARERKKHYGSRKALNKQMADRQQMANRQQMADRQQMTQQRPLNPAELQHGHLQASKKRKADFSDKARNNPQPHGFRLLDDSEHQRHVHIPENIGAGKHHEPWLNIGDPTIRGRWQEAMEGAHHQRQADAAMQNELSAEELKRHLHQLSGPHHSAPLVSGHKDIILEREFENMQRQSAYHQSHQTQAHLPQRSSLSSNDPYSAIHSIANEVVNDPRYMRKKHELQQSQRQNFLDINLDRKPKVSTHYGYPQDSPDRKRQRAIQNMPHLSFEPSGQTHIGMPPPRHASFPAPRGAQFSSFASMTDEHLRNAEQNILHQLRPPSTFPSQAQLQMPQHKPSTFLPHGGNAQHLYVQILADKEREKVHRRG